MDTTLGNDNNPNDNPGQRPQKKNTLPFQKQEREILTRKWGYR